MASYLYDPWGNVILANETFTDGQGPFPYRYCGIWGVRYEPLLSSSATGSTYYMRQRWYSGALQRFFSRDRKRKTNRYSYANNRPTDLLDPMGLAPITGASLTIFNQALSLLSAFGNGAAATALQGMLDNNILAIIPGLSQGADDADPADSSWNSGTGQLELDPSLFLQTPDLPANIDCAGNSNFARALLLASDLLHEYIHSTDDTLAMSDPNFNPYDQTRHNQIYETQLAFINTVMSTVQSINPALAATADAVGYQVEQQARDTNNLIGVPRTFVNGPPGAF